MRLIGAAKTFTSVFSLILAAFLLKDALFPDYKPEIVNMGKISHAPVR